MSALLVAPRTAADAADLFNRQRLDVAIPCSDGLDGAETPGLTSADWTDEDSPRERLAAEACLSCKVVDACGEYALLAREPYGVWGGMTPADRRKMLRRQGVRLPG